MDRTEQTEPMLPMDSTEPIDPTERTDPREAIDRRESCERQDQPLMRARGAEAG